LVRHLATNHHKTFSATLLWPCFNTPEEQYLRSQLNSLGFALAHTYPTGSRLFVSQPAYQQWHTFPTAPPLRALAPATSWPIQIWRRTDTRTPKQASRASLFKRPT
jgi:hypothetical protein